MEAVEAMLADPSDDGMLAASRCAAALSKLQSGFAACALTCRVQEFHRLADSTTEGTIRDGWTAT
jgi:hypothetical protein